MDFFFIHISLTQLGEKFQFQIPWIKEKWCLILPIDSCCSIIVHIEFGSINMRKCWRVLIQTKKEFQKKILMFGHCSNFGKLVGWELFQHPLVCIKLPFIIFQSVYSLFYICFSICVYAGICHSVSECINASLTHFAWLYV